MKHKLNPRKFEVDEIQSIELIGDTELMDITLEDTHMFYANDIYTHNCGANEDVVQAHNIADSYRKIMTADVVISVSRKTSDKSKGTARFHIMKNRFGADGLTFPAKMNTSCGDIELFDPNSQDGIELQNLMGEDSEEETNIVKKKLNQTYNQMKRSKG